MLKSSVEGLKFPSQWGVYPTARVKHSSLILALGSNPSGLQPFHLPFQVQFRISGGSSLCSTLCCLCSMSLSPRPR